MMKQRGRKKQVQEIDHEKYDFEGDDERNNDFEDNMND